MARRIPTLLAGALLVAVLPASGPHPLRIRAQVHQGPAPATEVVGEDDEGRGLEAWIEQSHRAPPGVDWRAVEADNVRTLIERRRALRSASPGQWVERGSENQAGSMYNVTRSTDGASLVAGASLGGVWRADREGVGWTPLGDRAYGGAHELVVLPPDVLGGPDVMLTCPLFLDLVLRSADDGATWVTPAGLASNLIGARRITVDPAGTVWMVGITPTTSLLYRSTDRGLTFEQLLDLNAWGDVWVPRIGESAVYALGGQQLYVSHDGGDTFEVHPAPEERFTARIAGSEATDPPRLYVVMDGWIGSGGERVYSSNDEGADWRAGATLVDFWDVLTASIRDPNLVAAGGGEMYRSTDGGASFAKVSAWDDYYGDPEHKLHSDVMAIDVYPDPGHGETWYVGTHGGVYASVDGLVNVENLSLGGLRVGQYYTVLTNRDDPTQVLVGSQDQGLQFADVDSVEGTDRWTFDQVYSGDYGHLVSTDGSFDWVFADYPGFILVWHDGELGFIDFPPDPVIPPWLPLLAPDPQGQPDAFLFGGAQLWRYAQDADGWGLEPLSSRSFDGSPGEYVSAVAFSPLDPDLGFLVTSAGRMFRSTDRGVDWDPVGDGPIGVDLYGTALVASHLDRGLVYVGGSGYDGTAVYRSVDAGRTWQPWADDLPPTMVYSLAEVSDGTGRVVAGTEEAVYVRDPAGGGWVDVTADAPITRYWTADALASEDTVRFATFGRGVWDYRLEPQGEGCWATRDQDGDGVRCELDCDDTDPGAFPGLEEVPCDGVDNDCDGVDSCPDDPTPATTTTPSDPTTTTPRAPAPNATGGCGCGGSPGPSGALVVLPIAWIRWRTRQGALDNFTR